MIVVVKMSAWKIISYPLKSHHNLAQIKAKQTTRHDKNNSNKNSDEVLLPYQPSQPCFYPEAN